MRTIPQLPREKLGVFPTPPFYKLERISADGRAAAPPDMCFLVILFSEEYLYPWSIFPLPLKN